MICDVCKKDVHRCLLVRENQKSAWVCEECNPNKEQIDYYRVVQTKFSK